MTRGKVLVIGTNADQIELRGGRTAPTGQYLNETAVPAMAVIDAGYDVVLATPTGAKPHIDPVSDSPDHFGGDDAVWRRAQSFFESHPSMAAGRTLRSVIAEGLDGYAGVFVPGGQGPVVDLMQDADTGEVLRHFHDRGKPTALLCHGPVATVSAMADPAAFRAALVAGDLAAAARLAAQWPYAGYRMTVFSESEEDLVETHILGAELYFDMVGALALAGGRVVTGKVDFDPHVIEDRELITGQNPRSDAPLAARFIAALDRFRAQG